jgi:hypothetical protein
LGGFYCYDAFVEAMEAVVIVIRGSCGLSYLYGLVFLGEGEICSAFYFVIFYVCLCASIFGYITVSKNIITQCSITDKALITRFIALIFINILLFVFNATICLS